MGDEATKPPQNFIILGILYLKQTSYACVTNVKF